MFEPDDDLLSLEDLKEVFFSIENVFFPSLESDEISIFLDTPVEMVKVFFLFFWSTINDLFKYYLPC